LPPRYLNSHKGNRDDRDPDRYGVLHRHGGRTFNFKIVSCRDIVVDATGELFHLLRPCEELLLELLVSGALGQVNDRLMGFSHVVEELGADRPPLFGKSI
jgi:hypothetical protein